jgi:hypothetical protein
LNVIQFGFGNPEGVELDYVKVFDPVRVGEIQVNVSSIHGFLPWLFKV